MAKQLQKIATKYAGVRYRENPDRKMKNGSADRYYFVRYKLNGVLKEEGLGWASEGWTAEKANAVRFDLRKSQKTGRGPKTLNEAKEASIKIVKAKEAAAEIESAMSMTLTQFFKNHFLPRAKKEKRTWDTDQMRYFKRIDPALGDRPINEIKSHDVQEFIDSIVEEEAAPATVQQYKALIRRVFNVASQTMIENRPLFSGINPATNVRVPDIKNSRERFLTGEEAEKLISAASKLARKDLHDAIVLSLNTGLRLGEIQRLTWIDVNFASNMVTVRDEAHRKPGGKVPINAAVKTVLLERKKSAEPTDLVFPPIYGKSYRENFGHLFKEIVDRLGFNKNLDQKDARNRVVFHTLRHTFASWLAMAGVDIYRIKTLMRHKTLTMTMRYAHLIPDATHEAVQNLAPPKIT